MMLDHDYRSLAQKVRQTARARLIGIRQARLAGKPEPAEGTALQRADSRAQAAPVADGVTRRRRRKAGRVLRQMQDARLMAAIAAGAIEIWDEPVALAQPSQVPDDCPVLTDTSPAEPWQVAALPALVTASGPRAQWDEAGCFGPVRDPWLTRDPAQAEPELSGQDGEVDLSEAGEMFGPFLLPPGLRQRDTVRGDSVTDQEPPRAMTLSAGMRVVQAAIGIAEDAASAAPDLKTVVQDMAVATRGAACGGDPLPGPDGAGPDTPAQAVLLHAHDMLAGNLAKGSGKGHRDGDLTSLPGAGPGLIWMLQKCGISSLDDLAQTDAATLVPRLGLVGQIVNVQGWMRYAQRQVRLTH